MTIEINNYEILPEDAEFLEHFGMKGMKWGVRRQRRAESTARVGRGEGGGASKLRAVGTAVSRHPIDILRGHANLAKTSKITATRQISRNKRVQSGHGSAMDIIKYYGSTRFQDLIPVKSKNAKLGMNAKKGKNMRGDVLAIGVGGAIVARKMMQRRAAKQAFSSLQ